MKIQLNQTEIEDAIKLYIADQGINLDHCDVDMSFTAGRGAQGTMVDVDIVKSGSKPSVVVDDAAVEVAQAKPEEKVTPIKSTSKKTKAEPAAEEAATPTVTKEPEFSDPEEEPPFATDEEEKSEEEAPAEAPKAKKSLFS